MRYEELLALCSELHNNQYDRRRNFEIQKALNAWEQTVDLSNALELLESCAVKSDYGYVFIYVLSALQSALSKCAARIPGRVKPSLICDNVMTCAQWFHYPVMKVKELGEIKKRLILLLENGKLNGFNIIKVAKLITIILFNELWAVDDALCITIFAISNETIKLDVIRVFIEDFLSAKSLGLEHQTHIYTCLYQSAQYIIGRDCQVFGAFLKV